MGINENFFFRQATLKICGDLAIEKALHESLNYLSNIIPANFICLEIFEPSINSLRIIATATRSEFKSTNLLVRIDENASKLMEHIYKKFKISKLPDAVVINNSDNDPVARLILESLNEPTSSILHMALETEGRPLCSIIMGAAGPNRYSDEESRLFSLLKEPFSVALSNALKHREIIHLKELLTDDNRFLHRQLLDLSGTQIIGADFGLKKVMGMVRQVSVHNSPVLLLGETGTGKDVIANAIHYSSPRKDAPFITVNCGAIPENLIDSELFGHEKGAFTGAVSKKRGRFERADGGTIFLDEIGELPPQAQVRLLRVLQNNEIERVGGTEKIPLDIRVIAATNKNLVEMVETRQFREDLWFRINVFPIQLPGLRQRKEDIPAFVKYFINKKSKELKLQFTPEPAPGAIERLVEYNWPGNVRELENIIERALIVCKNGLLTFDNIETSTGIEPAAKETSYDDSKLPEFNEYISDYIKTCLAHTNGKIHGKGGAAELMGINPSTLRSKIKKLGISGK